MSRKISVYQSFPYILNRVGKNFFTYHALMVLSGRKGLMHLKRDKHSNGGSSLLNSNVASMMSKEESDFLNQSVDPSTTIQTV